MSTEQKTFNLQISEQNKCGVYANVLAVSMNNQEVVLDFGYRMPGNQGQDVQIVSRVNLSHTTAKQVITTLQNTVLDFENKQNKKG